MKRAALPLVCGVYGRMRSCWQAAGEHAGLAKPLSVIIRCTVTSPDSAPRHAPRTPHGALLVLVRDHAHLRTRMMVFDGGTGKLPAYAAQPVPAISVHVTRWLGRSIRPSVLLSMWISLSGVERS